MISNVISRGSAYHVYDMSGKEIAFIPNSVGELLGVCIDFVILQNGGLFVTFDEFGKRVASIPTIQGSFKNATGSTFNLVKNGLITSYNKQCQKIGSKSI